MDWITSIGFIAAACTTFAFIPQALKTIKTKHTKDLSLVMYIVVNIGIFLWLIYGILRNDYPVLIANAVTLIFTSTILYLKIKYK